MNAAAPRSPGELFVVWALIALQSFGGALAVIERTLVRDKRWLDAKEFVGTFGISQALPGPTGVALCVLLGDRFFGLRGAAAALAGFLLVPAVLVIALTTLFAHFQHLPWVEGALRGMGAASVGVVIATALRMARTLRGQSMGIAVALLAFAAVAFAQLPVGSIVLTLGAASVAWAWRAIDR